MFCHDSLDDRVNFIPGIVDSSVLHSPQTSAHLSDALFTMVYKPAWPSTSPPGENFLNLLGTDCLSPRGLICRATCFSHLIFSPPHQDFSSQTQVVKKSQPHQHGQEYHCHFLHQLQVFNANCPPPYMLCITMLSR